MIVDLSQKNDRIIISSVNIDGLIDIDTILMDEDNPEEYYFKYVEADINDPKSIPDLKSFRGSNIKKEKTHYFEGTHLNEFLNVELKSRSQQVFEKSRLMKFPNPFAFDIETDITDEYGYSSSELVENKILSISITDINLSTILLVVKNEAQPDFAKNNEINPIEKGVIDNILSDTLGKYFYKGGQDEKNQIEYSVIVFDNEYDMLNTFLQYINKFFHLLIGWNSSGFDLPYLINRCKKIGLDFRKASPTNEMSNGKKSVNKALVRDVPYPKHRLTMDYMNVFKASPKYTTLESFSLDSVSENILKTKKVVYEGNLKTLYDNDYLRFISYAFVDTILVMLLHKTTNLLSTFFFQAHYCRMPFSLLNQNPISMALIYNKLRSKNIFMLSSEYTNNKKREYIGGYVKEPTKHSTNSVMGIDFNSLYPNSMITGYLSVETKFPDTIEMINGTPKDDFNRQKFEQYVSSGYCVTPMGRIYKADPNNLVGSIERDLLDERKIYKSAMTDIYLNLIPKIKKKLEELS
jgi:DNA polymerase elongation subunit (family B)